MSGRELKLGEVVMHSCDVPRCVNPDHLKAGTQQQNIADMASKGRHGAQRNPKAFSARLDGIRGVSHGEKNGSAKLREETVKQIRTSPLSLSEVAKACGISKTQAARIRNKQSWKKLT